MSVCGSDCLFTACGVLGGCLSGVVSFPIRWRISGGVPSLLLMEDLRQNVGVMISVKNSGSVGGSSFVGYLRQLSRLLWFPGLENSGGAFCCLSVVLPITIGIFCLLGLFRTWSAVCPSVCGSGSLCGLWACCTASGGV